MKNPKTDPMDYNGMGDFSRYRNAFEGTPSLESKIREWFKQLLSNRKTE